MITINFRMKNGDVVPITSLVKQAYERGFVVQVQGDLPCVGGLEAHVLTIGRPQQPPYTETGKLGYPRYYVMRQVDQQGAFAGAVLEIEESPNTVGTAAIRLGAFHEWPKLEAALLTRMPKKST